MKKNSTVYFAKNMADVLYQLKTTSGLRICGAGTLDNSLPDIVLFIRNINDFKIIDRRERYVEFGSAVTLSQLLELGHNRLPSVFFEALSQTAIPSVRNVATVGGNICAAGIKRTLFAPLLALDARLELKSQTEAKILSMSQFDQVPPGFMLTRIRVPLDEWDVAVFRRVGPVYAIDESSASYTFLASTQKGLLSVLRIAFCGAVRFRSRDLENMFAGTKLPLSDKDIQNMLEAASRIFTESVNREQNGSVSVSEVLRDIIKIRFLNLLKYSFEQLT